MIKFFRKIRQKLLSENRFSKYLLYAIGEIFLVVIGIMIALQINNLNEARKASNNELQLYVKLLYDINEEYTVTINQINSNKSYQDVHYQVYLESIGKADYDSTQYYNSLQWIFPYHLSITDKHTESLTSISNDNIRDLLKAYISTEKATQAAYTEWNDIKVERLRPFFNKHGIHNTEAAFNNRRYTFWSLSSVDLIDHAKLEEHYGSTELDELLFDLRFKTSWLYENLNWLKSANNRLELALVNELKLTRQAGNILRIPRKKLADLLDEELSIDDILETIKNEDDKAPVYDIDQEEVNQFGYDLIELERLADALKIFKLNTELHPDGWNTWDSYGECLLLLKDTANAINAYEKSLELDPDNCHAGDILNEIKPQ